MSEETLNDELLALVKVLIDPDRLAIAGRLFNAKMSIEALADELGLARNHVQRHLDRLIEAGLVLQVERRYTLDRDALHTRARRLLASAQRGAPPANFDEKVLADYMRPDGSLKDIPAQLKKKQVIYRYIAGQFETGRVYSEKEVNEVLMHFHHDIASIRRDLFDLGFIGREPDGSAYWLIQTT
jgi:hypothetical protein